MSREKLFLGSLDNNPVEKWKSRLTWLVGCLSDPTGLNDRPKKGETAAKTDVNITSYLEKWSAGTSIQTRLWFARFMRKRMTKKSSLYITGFETFAKQYIDTACRIDPLLVFVYNHPTIECPVEIAAVIIDSLNKKIASAKNQLERECCTHLRDGFVAISKVANCEAKKFTLAASPEHASLKEYIMKELILPKIMREIGALSIHRPPTTQEMEDQGLSKMEVGRMLSNDILTKNGMERLLVDLGLSFTIAIEGRTVDPSNPVEQREIGLANGVLSTLRQLRKSNREVHERVFLVPINYNKTSVTETMGEIRVDFGKMWHSSAFEGNTYPQEFLGTVFPPAQGYIHAADAEELANSEGETV